LEWNVDQAGLLEIIMDELGLSLNSEKIPTTIGPEYDALVEEAVREVLSKYTKRIPGVANNTG
jgi:hypothetical protein